MTNYYFYTQPGIGDNLAAHGQDFPVLRTYGILKSIKDREPESVITCCVSSVYNPASIETVELNPYIDNIRVGPEWVSNNLGYEFNKRNKFFAEFAEGKVDLSDAKISMQFDYEDCPVYFSKGDVAVRDYIYVNHIQKSKTVGIHIWSGKASGGDFKHWPFERWTFLVKFLSEKGYKVLQLGRNTEECVPGTISLLNNSFRQQLCVLESLDAFIGTDSAFKSAGYLYRIPTVVLWPAHPNEEIRRQQLRHNHWRDGEPQIRLLRCKEVSELSLETVKSAFTEIESGGMV